jgi:nucleoid DNA-binding protein
MTLTELAKKVAQVTGHDNEEIGAILDVMVTLMANRLRAGEELRVRGLGTFYWQKRKATRRRHPTSGELIEVPEKHVLRFRPVGSLKVKEI